MKREMSYKNLERVLNLLTKIATKEVNPRWEIAKRKRVVRAELETVDEARELPDDMKKYNDKQLEIYREYGTLIGGQGAASSFRIDPENLGDVKRETDKLKEEFAEILEADKKRLEDIEELLKKTAEVDLEPIDYEWIGDFLDSNDVETLIELDMVNEPRGEDEEYEEVDQTRAKKARNQRKKARRKQQ